MDKLEINKLEEQIRYQAQFDGITHFSTGIAIFDSNGKLLVVKRSDKDDFLPGYFELPGGGVEPGENFLQGIKRETIEEIGVDIDTIQYMQIGFDYTTQKKPKVRQINFVCIIDKINIQLSDEHSEYMFILEEDIDELKSDASMKKCLHDMFDIYKKLIS